MEPNTRRCGRCKETKEESQFYGPSRRCKKCENETSKLYREKHLTKRALRIRENVLLIKHGKLKCSVCEQIKDVSEFNKNKEQSTGYLNKCKDCDKKYRKENQISYKDKCEEVKQKIKDGEVLLFECKWCGETKPVSKFRITNYSARGVSYECKQCKNRYDTDRQKLLTKEQRLHIFLMSSYKLSFDDYKKMYESQNGKCAICGVDGPMLGSQRLGVDHCHETGKVRKLLCNSCNSVIGHSKESLIILRKTTEYLLWWKQELDKIREVSW